MNRLTEHDDQGNWCLKGIAWSQLKIGQVITKETWEKLYGALWKLKDYEDTGLTPEEIMELKEFYSNPLNTAVPAVKVQQWIPVEERLPEDDDFVLLSFENFSLLMIGRYEIDEDGGGAWYLGDCDEGDTCVSQNLFVNAWMPLPERYRGED